VEAYDVLRDDSKRITYDKSALHRTVSAPEAYGRDCFSSPLTPETKHRNRTRVSSESSLFSLSSYPKQHASQHPTSHRSALNPETDPMLSAFFPKNSLGQARERFQQPKVADDGGDSPEATQKGVGNQATGRRSTLPSGWQVSNQQVERVESRNTGAPRSQNQNEAGRPKSKHNDGSSFRQEQAIWGGFSRASYTDNPWGVRAQTSVNKSSRTTLAPQFSKSYSDGSSQRELRTSWDCSFNGRAQNQRSNDTFSYFPQGWLRTATCGPSIRLS